MKTRMIIILGALLVVSGFLFMYKVFADYSDAAASSTGLCYVEDWKATEFYILQQNKENNKFEFSYVNAGTSDPRNLDNNAVLSDFVPTKWEVTGGVSFKSEE